MLSKNFKIGLKFMELKAHNLMDQDDAKHNRKIAFTCEANLRLFKLH